MNAPGLLASAAARPRRFPSALIERFALDDGRRVLVRPVLALDADAEQDFVRALSPATRLKRFHFGLRELPPPLLRAMTEVDHDAHVAIVAEGLPNIDNTDDDSDEGAPIIVADARYVRGPSADLASDEAEFAIAVADAWQGRRPRPRADEAPVLPRCPASCAQAGGRCAARQPRDVCVGRRARWHHGGVTQRAGGDAGAV